MAVITTLFVDPVEPDGTSKGTGYTVDVPMRAVMDWERLFPRRSLATLTTAAGLSAHDMYELTYVALKRDGKPLPDKFTDYVDQNEVMTMALAKAVGLIDEPDPEPEREAAPDPTPMDQSTEP